MWSVPVSRVSCSRASAYAPPRPLVAVVTQPGAQLVLCSPSRSGGSHTWIRCRTCFVWTGRGARSSYPDVSPIEISPAHPRARHLPYRGWAVTRVDHDTHLPLRASARVGVTHHQALFQFYTPADIAGPQAVLADDQVQRALGIALDDALHGLTDERSFCSS